jgi:hypothetical protein
VHHVCDGEKVLYKCVGVLDSLSDFKIYNTPLVSKKKDIYTSLVKKIKDIYTSNNSLPNIYITRLWLIENYCNIKYKII